MMNRNAQTLGDAKDKVLYVSLTSSVLRSELVLCRERLVKSLNDYAGSEVIQDIVIR